MTTTQKKIIFTIIWLALLSLGPISVFHNTPLSIATRNSVTLLNFIQRIVGVIAFTMLFSQIILGFFMSKLTEKLGGWIYSFHVFEGITVYFLIVLHPVLFVLFNYFVGKGLDPFYVFLAFCALCQTRAELYYTLARISFIFITTSVAAGFFRTATPWLRMNWKKLHVINYLSFLLIAIHSLGVGTDVGTPPFSLLHGPAMVIVGGLAAFKLFKFIKSEFSK